MKECSTCSLCFDDSAKFCPNDGTLLVDSIPGGRDIDGRWRLERVLGVGRQGAAYVATDLEGDRHALVKTFLPVLFAEPGSFDRFLADADKLFALDHPNAAHTYAAGHLPNGGGYLASEYLAGRTLKTALANDGPFEPGRAVRIAAAVADALGAAHALDILHRDVKPGNVMLADEGGAERTVLVDFKSARWMQGPGGASVTATGSLVMRLPHYTSPEQCRGEQPDARSDLYALGCVLYEMLTGRPPFDAPVPMAIIVKHVTDPPEPPSQVRASVPSEVERVVLRALEKAPGDRFQTAAEMASALRESVGEPAPAASAPSAPAEEACPPAPLPPPEAEPEQRRIPAPPAPLAMRMTIIDADNEEHASRIIDGLVSDLGENGMRIQTGTIATGRLNVIRDHTTAFKNRLEIDVDLPSGTVHISGFAAWYKPAPDGINWNVGVYIRDMTSADRGRYNAYLESLSSSQ